MTGSKSIQGIIFDMDNTLLKSEIDFQQMKESVYLFLIKKKILEPSETWKEETASQLIEQGRIHPDFHKVEEEVWQLVSDVEAEGMHEAHLEPFAKEMLQILKQTGKIMTILTNNAYPAAKDALERLDIYDLFDVVLGRDQLPALKPSPSGLHLILNRWPGIPLENWVFIGDSWIDGMAAQNVGMDFISYQGNLDELKKKDIIPTHSIDHLTELQSLLATT